MKIGFFDSGIGGLTVLNESLKMLPNEDYIYYADVLHVPYGTKPKEEVRKYVFEAVTFLSKQNIKALVIACNTATSIAVDNLRCEFDFPIIGMEPAVKPAIENNSNINKRVLVFATELTLKEDKFKKLVSKVDNDNIVDFLPLGGLVKFAENFIFDEEVITTYLKEELSTFDLNLYSTVVLGCTHFPIYKNMFKKVLPPHIAIIDGNLGTVKNLKTTLENKNLLNGGNGNIIFYRSGKMVEDNKTISKYKSILNLLNSDS